MILYICDFNDFRLPILDLRSLCKKFKLQMPLGLNLLALHVLELK